ncbi:hypothetical protein BGZ72_000089 [Mortierella alpina]|nr:hypothetical protein BGZ72_000089 [Mortierella alpina]
MPPFETQQEVLPIQLSIQPLNMSRRRGSRAIARSDTIAGTSSASGSVNNNTAIPATVASISVEKGSKPAAGGASNTTLHPLPLASAGPLETQSRASPLTWLSRVITKAGQDERLHYHPHGQHHHHHHHHHNHHHQHSRSPSAGHGHVSPSAPLVQQLFSKATVVTLEKKYATVHWAAEFYCTISSPCFALPILLYCDPSFRWSAPEIHTTHFAIFLSVLTALTSMLYHATLYKIFSSLDACFATIMFYINTIHLLKSLPDPYALMVPDLIASVVHSHWTPYLVATGMMALFIFSWQRTAMLSLLLMVVMIPATIWGFVAHESWAGLAFGLLGLSMFAADRFKFFCGHSYWHLAGGLSLWYGIASGALAK